MNTSAGVVLIIATIAALAFIQWLQRVNKTRRRENERAAGEIPPADHHLSREESVRLAYEWGRVQERFEDHPHKAVAKADELVNEVLRVHGDFEHEDEHPRTLELYRIAHDIALRDQYGQAFSEELRKAMRLYRNVFEEAVEVRTSELERQDKDRRGSPGPSRRFA